MTIGGLYTVQYSLVHPSLSSTVEQHKDHNDMTFLNCAIIFFTPAGSDSLGEVMEVEGNFFVHLPLHLGYFFL